MKKILLSFLWILPFLLGAQQAEKIFSITEKRFPVEYYHQQAKLWKEILNKDTLNTEAWENYYAASRMANFLSTDPAYNLDEIIAEAAIAIPETFTYNYLAHWNYSPQAKHKKYVEKAYQIDPNRPEIYSCLVLMSEQDGERERRKKFSKKWYESNDIDREVLTWNYNQLASIEDNAILLTFGDNDTYPAWVLQDVKSMKPNAAILNIHLLKDFHYRNQVMTDFGIPAFKVGKERTVLNSTDTLIAVLDHLVKQQKRPVYFGVAASKEIRNRYDANLYLVGMAFKYSEEPFDNLAILKQNVEDKMLLDNLKIPFKQHDETSVVHRMNANYIPGFLLLYDYYQKQGEYQKAKDLKEVINKLAYSANMETRIVDYFKSQPEFDTAVGSIISIKDIEKNLKEIQPGLYANATEVSNEEYETFLIDLLKQKKTELLQLCQSEKTDWRTLAVERLSNAAAKDPKGRLINQRKDEVEGCIDFAKITDQILYNHGHPDDPKSPVQNIQHEAAKAYCYWITQVYNRSDKKRKFKKVIFRLPTEKEWELAAQSNAAKDAPYPWGGYYFKNEKGCYVLNANTSREDNCCEENRKIRGACDGLYFGGITDAYFPNDKGLYNTSGNVAEMIETEGVAKGGSWEDIPEDCVIDSRKRYNGPDPAIGFRIFMEIVER